MRAEFHVGIDIASVARIGSIVERYTGAVLNRVFTVDELRRSQSQPRRSRYLSICFAAKEAVGKALGCGMAGIEWFDVEATIRGGQVMLQLRGAAAERACQLGIKDFAASWSEIDDEWVMVFVIAQSSEGEFDRGPA